MDKAIGTMGQMSTYSKKTMYIRMTAVPVEIKFESYCLNPVKH